MSEKSYNGWPASSDPKTIGVVDLVVNGVEFYGGCRSGDVHTVLTHVLEQFDLRVEPLKNPGCWGFSYRANRNDPSELSCHASATAGDANAPAHPNGVEASKTFSKTQIAEIHLILSEIPELADVVHWGGDWHKADGLTPDPMHWEIHDHDLVKLARVAARITEKETDPMLELLKDLTVVVKAHKVTLPYAARVLLWGAAKHNKGARLARINAARVPLKGMDDPKK